MTRRARSKNEYQRLTAQGVDVEPPEPVDLGIGFQVGQRVRVKTTGRYGRVHAIRGPIIHVRIFPSRTTIYFHQHKLEHAEDNDA